MNLLSRFVRKYVFQLFDQKRLVNQKIIYLYFLILHITYDSLSDYRGMAKWFGAHYNQEVRFISVKCKKGPLNIQTKKYCQLMVGCITSCGCAQRSFFPSFIIVRISGSFRFKDLFARRRAAEPQPLCWSLLASSLCQALNQTTWVLSKHDWQLLMCQEAWLPERLRRWSNKPDVVGSIPVTTEFSLISCDSNQVPKWFGTHYNLKVPL